ncbi:hypothetical protein GA707_12425 [Nostocoides sp. F2B08]|uniref:gluconokinase n=1 Tax=Nostocoides sp. F2B08 TaxID=2653936 RepID=UPI001263B45D|nr:gluconokinase [Tetrasphaera sp. F2B08]KAB7744240.1 hypothetical protein GA707_12425 [Tetrasphaera sp. F2B08]
MSTAPPTRPTRVVIGVDVGTTATKVVAFGLDIRWTHVASRTYPTEHPNPGWHEQDPAELMSAVLEGLTECVGAIGEAQVVGLGVSTAMHGLIGLAEDGTPLTPLVTWADTRAVDEVEALRESGQDLELHRATGTPVHPMSPLAKIMWFTRNEPELSAAVDQWVGLKTWIVRGLTAQVVCDLSSASDSGLLNRATGTWHQGALAWAGIGAERLPPIVPTTHSMPLATETAEVTGLPPGTPVVIGAGDGPTGNLGTDAIHPGTIGVSIGTSAAARAVLPGPVLDLPRGLFCYALADDLWVVGGAASNGGSASRWVVDLLHQQDRDGDDETEALAAAGQVSPGSDGLYVVPYLRPERSPLWDVDIPGAVLGLRHHHTGAHLVRATVEGVAVQLAAVVEQIRLLEEVTEIRATGGAFRAPVWGRVLAALTELPVVVTDSAAGSARGAAALALYALGQAASLADGASALAPAETSVVTYEPAPDDVTAYRVWRAGASETYARLAAPIGLVGGAGAPWLAH